MVFPSIPRELYRPRLKPGGGTVFFIPCYLSGCILYRTINVRIGFYECKGPERNPLLLYARLL